jgi:D-alanyl-lipoteichoic acid acyltransferase DltB (MBOAT superfamily)
MPAADSYYSTDANEEDDEVADATRGMDSDGGGAEGYDDEEEDDDDEAALLTSDALTSRRHPRSPFGRSSKDRSQESALRRSRPTAYGSVKLPAAQGPPRRGRGYQPQGPPYGPVPLEVTPPLRVVLYTVVAFGMGVYVHGNDFAVLLAILGMSYAITRGFGRSVWSPRLHWVFVMILLVASADNQEPLNFARDWTLRGHGWGLDAIGLRGVFPWTYIYRLLFLRIVSYNMDTYLALNSIEHTRRASASDYLVRQECSLPLSEYRRFSLYLAYTFYAPVYATGPTLSFNAFVSQVQVPQSGGMSRPKWLQHALRLGLYMVLFEVYRCMVYLGALPFPNRQLNQLSEPADFALVAFFVLVTNYMKFLIIWRFARLLALLDGIDVPDDMVRCFMSQYTFTSFWRSWHASINVWAIRYMYIPAGGTRRKGLLLWMIFLFIGLWHSVGWDKLLWAVANAVGFTAEITLNTTAAKWAPDRESWFIWPYLRAAAGGLCIIALMFANIFIIGYPVASRLLSGAFLQGTASLPVWAYLWFTGSCIARVADLRATQLADLPSPPKTDSAKCFTCLR